MAGDLGSKISVGVKNIDRNQVTGKSKESRQTQIYKVGKYSWVSCGESLSSMGMWVQGALSRRSLLCSCRTLTLLHLVFTMDTKSGCYVPESGEAAKAQRI